MHLKNLILFLVYQYRSFVKKNIEIYVYKEYLYLGVTREEQFKK